MGRVEADFRPLKVLIFSVLAILLTGYYYNDPLVYGDIHWLRIGLYLVIPLLLNQFYFRISWSELGLGRPRLQGRALWMLVSLCLIVPLIAYLVQFSPDYLAAYPYYRNPEIPPAVRFNHFFLFTLSTLPGWEFMLRAFTLFGLRFLFLEKHKLEQKMANLLALLFVCAFEVLYHLVKPDLEAFGMLLASPALSWLALKTKSFWIPLGLHMAIELAFILGVIYS